MAKIVGEIPSGAGEKIADTIPDPKSIRIVWAEYATVRVVGFDKGKLFGYRYFKIGDEWSWSADYHELYPDM